ncbi:polysaccharide deacetylase family protein [Candidatus Daviesbacteria bacterium]|nr:polysaccharide deacetylase family protein [Candidatus Daviesbacteria bacterium]
MFNLKQIFAKDFKSLVWDLTHHFIYTLFIVAIASVLTYFLINSKIEKVIQIEVAKNPTKQTTTVILPEAKESLYVERGSPYDNRTLEDTSSSAKVIFHGPRDKKRIALTFDAEMTDGMKADLVSGRVKSSYDQKIVAILNQTQTKATFFLTGLWIEIYPNVTKDLSKNNLFELGSHSYTDSSYYGFCYGLKQISNTLKIEDIGATEKLLREHAGIDNRLFRFPGGCYTPDDVKLVNQANDTVVHWDISGADGFNVNTQQIVHNIVDNVQNGSIIILHLNGPPNAPKTGEALPEIISVLKAKGFEFVKVSELLGLPLAPRILN